ncbi:hypothetical protein [Microbispora sp. NPDC049633]|uniref:hypothetical protein n=1 Tax=Microbispora sp. NPDC049633 TaxID=3154355 RepID=UPI00342F55C4
MTEEVNHVRLVVDLRFEGDYYGRDELVKVATRWINSGLDDRSDLDTVKISGTVLPTCAHCGQVIEGDGHTWIGPLPEPGQPQLKYHLSPAFPDCRRASGACGSQS